MNRKIIECRRCLYNENTPAFVLTPDGTCNYCRTHDEMDREYPIGEAGEKRLQAIAEKIRKVQKGKNYDVVIGVSGGCDSSYMLYQAKRLGLRPLAVHFDNTWNSTIAVENIQTMLKKLDIELYTVVVDNEEYDDIYRAFIKAGVVEVDAATDIAMTTVMYRAAAKFGIKYIFEGHSFRTEGSSPLGWSYFDGKYIQSVLKRFSNRKIKTFPNLTFSYFIKCLIWNRFIRIRPLYFEEYNKEKTKEFLTSEFGWQWYGGHHLENRFSAWSHSYYLPTRFGIDQRANGYSAMVRSGQMAREEAARLLAEPPKADAGIIQYLNKRLGYTDEEFKQILLEPTRTFREFETYKPLFVRYRWFFYLMYKMELVPKSFFVKYCSKLELD